jgi:phage terminase small subunit
MRAFVVALVQTGCAPSKACEMAGYSACSQNSFATMGWKLARDPRIQAAIHEEALKVLRADGPMALSVLREIAADKSAGNRDRIKAATELLNRGGFHAVSQHNITVTHQSEQDKEREILALATELGLDDAAKAKLLGKPIVTEAQSTIVDPETDIAPPRQPTGRPISSTTRTPEDRARQRAIYHATPEEREERKRALREENRERLKREYAEAQAKKAKPTAADLELEDLLRLDEPIADEAGIASTFNPQGDQT